MCSVPRAALTRPTEGALRGRNVLSQSAAGCGQGHFLRKPLLGWQMPPSPYMSVLVSSSPRTPVSSCWIRVHPKDLLLASSPLWKPLPNRTICEALSVRTASCGRWAWGQPHPEHREQGSSAGPRESVRPRKTQPKPPAHASSVFQVQGSRSYSPGFCTMEGPLQNSHRKE